MNKKEKEIIDGAFDFIKYYCEFCGRKVRFAGTFCSVSCKQAFFRKQKQIKNSRYISKKKQRKRRIHGLSDILDEEQIAEMKREVENNLKKV